MQFARRDPLYQALDALLVDYAATRRVRNLEDDQTAILLVPFAPGWYRLVAAELAWWQRWEESERLEQTGWWERTPLQEQENRLWRAQAEMAAFAAFLKARILAHPLAICQ